MRARGLVPEGPLHSPDAAHLEAGRVHSDHAPARDSRDAPWGAYGRCPGAGAIAGASPGGCAILSNSAGRIVPFPRRGDPTSPGSFSFLRAPGSTRSPASLGTRAVPRSSGGRSPAASGARGTSEDRNVCDPTPAASGRNAGRARRDHEAAPAKARRKGEGTTGTPHVRRSGPRGASRVTGGAEGPSHRARSSRETAGHGTPLWFNSISIDPAVGSLLRPRARSRRQGLVSGIDAPSQGLIQPGGISTHDHDAAACRHPGHGRGRLHRVGAGGRSRDAFPIAGTGRKCSPAAARWDASPDGSDVGQDPWSRLGVSSSGSRRDGTARVASSPS